METQEQGIHPMSRSEATPRTPLQQAKEATELARDAFASGHEAVGIAAVTLAAQLTQLAKLWGHTE